jgi:hypothetical protein
VHSVNPLIEREKGDILLCCLVRGRQRSRSVNSRPMRSVAVILVKHILQRVAAVQNVVTNPSDGSSCGPWHSTIYNKIRSGSRQTVTKKKNVPSFTSLNQSKRFITARSQPRMLNQARPYPLSRRTSRDPQRCSIAKLKHVFPCSEEER